MKIRSFLSKINLPTKASAAYLGASLIGKSVGLITTPFFTRLISRDEYGNLTLYMTILGAASIICSAVSSGSAVYKGFKSFESKGGEFINSALTVSLCFSTIICLLLFALSPFLGLESWLYLPLSLQILCDSIVGFSLARARYFYKYGEVMMINLLSSALPALISVIILWRVGGGYPVRIYSILALSIIIAVWQLIRLTRIEKGISKEMTRNMIKTSLPLLPHSFSTAVSGQMDKLFITSIMGSAALASYSVAHSLGISLQFAVTALGSSIGPWLIRKLDERNYERIKEVVSTVFSLFCAIALGLCTISPEIMKILAPDAYSDAIPAITPIALSVPLGFLSYVITVSLVQAEAGKRTAVTSVISLASCFIFNYTLIPVLGYFGAGLSHLLSQIASVSIGIIFLFRCGYEKFISIKRLGIIFAASLGVALLIIPFHKFLFLRVFILIVPTVILLNSLLHSKRLITE